MAGNYVAVITNSDSCQTSIAVTLDNVVATAEPAAVLLWEILPNPATSFLDVRFRGDARPDARLGLFDMLGRQVVADTMANGGTVRLAVGNLPNGLYQMLIRDRAQTIARPVVIQR